MTTRPTGKAERFWREKPSQDEDRVEFGRDYDRVLYSSAFRRLNGVTQVVSSDETGLFHNRLTHSLKVAQVGVRLHQHLEKQIARRRLGEIVGKHGGLDSRVVRAACMAHDLGHPPFGHIAEDALQQIVSANPDKTEKGNSIYPPIGTQDAFRLPDSFEGNAQSFRIVTKLAFREADEDRDVCRALNLTSGTLTGLLKYPWSQASRRRFTKKKKWGYYDSEETIFDWARLHIQEAYTTDSEQRTIEAQVMDWADDISYAVHDVEDFYRTGAVPLDLLFSSTDEMDQVLDYAWPEILRVSRGEVQRTALENRLHNLREDIFPDRAFHGSRADREKLHGFASKLITNAVDSTVLDEDRIVRPSAEQLAIVEFFKQLTWYYVIDRPALGSAQRGEVMLIRELFRDLTAWVKDDWGRGISELGGRQARRQQGLPVRLRDYLDVAFSPDPVTGCSEYDDENGENRKIARAVVDYIVSLTERQAVELGRRLSGHTPTSALEIWF